MRILKLTIKAIKRIYVELLLLFWEINKKFRKTSTITTRQGIFTILFADNAISKYLYIYKQHELDLVSETLKFLRSINKCPKKGEGTILDIGANYGIISIGAIHTGELLNAIAIEPEPQNFALLKRNVNQNGLTDKVLSLQYAVSDKKGDIKFELSGDNYFDKWI